MKTCEDCKADRRARDAKIDTIAAEICFMVDKPPLTSEENRLLGIKNRAEKIRLLLGESK